MAFSAITTKTQLGTDARRALSGPWRLTTEIHGEVDKEGRSRSSRYVMSKRPAATTI